MIFTQEIYDAMQFSIETHEVNQKQKRKGKDIPYVVHPLAVGLMLARAGASQEVIIAGLLHDTIEDSAPAHKVTRAILAQRFGEEVAALVDSVTEQDQRLPWEERKRQALEHIKDMSQGSMLVKSADVLSNVTELLDDHRRDGDPTFERFAASKEQTLGHYRALVEELLRVWPQNPFAHDLEHAAIGLRFALHGGER